MLSDDSEEIVTRLKQTKSFLIQLISHHTFSDSKYVVNFFQKNDEDYEKFYQDNKSKYTTSWTEMLTGVLSQMKLPFAKFKEIQLKWTYGASTKEG